MAKGATSRAAPDTVVFKKYGNRRLYDTAASRFVTLEDVGRMVTAGIDISVRDAKTGQDLTRLTLLQIILELHKDKVEVLPVQFLRQVISYREDTLRQFFERYLALSLEMYATAQDQFARRLAEGFGRSMQGFASLTSQPWMPMGAGWMSEQTSPGTSFAKASPPPAGADAPAGQSDPADEPSVTASLEERIRELERLLASGSRAPRVHRSRRKK